MSNGLNHVGEGFRFFLKKINKTERCTAVLDEKVENSAAERWLCDLPAEVRLMDEGARRELLIALCQG